MEEARLRFVPGKTPSDTERATACLAASSSEGSNVFAGRPLDTNPHSACSPQGIRTAAASVNTCVMQHAFSPPFAPPAHKPEGGLRLLTVGVSVADLTENHP